ncbi:TIGR02300 family protein [Novispirillum sp. DQ9]|uniref:TIGR02300 family protein n=1 Tax=Novispirillum sp. DQ9 TaxID=3398612 RepID=UPI003C7E27C8
MSKPEWGTKRTCTTCGARFYDMLKSPIVCPKCGAENEKETTKVKRGGKSSRGDAVKKVAAAKVVADEEDLDEDLIDAESDADDDDLMEDASDLGEDDEDMAEVIEHIEPGDDDE